MLTGEACFPWMFEEMPELCPFAAAMERLMEDTSFGKLYALGPSRQRNAAPGSRLL